MNSTHKSRISFPPHSCALFRVQTRKQYATFITLCIHRGWICASSQRCFNTFHTELDSAELSTDKKLREVWGHCRAHSCVMGGLRKDKRKYAVSDRDSNPAFLFLLYFLKKLLNDLTWNAFLWLGCNSLPLCGVSMNAQQVSDEQHPVIINPQKKVLSELHWSFYSCIWSLSVWEVWLVSVTSWKESYQNAVGVT